MATCERNIGLMPDPEDGCNGLQDIFVDNIYKDRVDAWVLTAAISGAHTLGNAKIENSGYQGAWSDEENQGKFNNDYFRSLIAKGWGPDRAVNGNPEKNQWKRVDLGMNAERKEMMLTTDLCLAYETNTDLAQCRIDNNCNKNNWNCKPCRKLLKKKQLQGDGDLDIDQGNCCAWTQKNGFGKPRGMANMETAKQHDYCGVDYFTTTIARKPEMTGRGLRGKPKKGEKGAKGGKKEKP